MTGSRDSLTLAHLLSFPSSALGLTASLLSSSQIPVYQKKPKDRENKEKETVP